MKLTKLIAITALLFGFAEFRALADVGLTVNITASFLIQNTNTFTNARTQSVTVSAPLRRTFSTANLLNRLAVDTSGGATNRFPRGARLVATNGTFVVMVGTNVIVDVSTFIKIDSGNNEVFSGTTDTNGLSRPSTTRTHLATVTFDDTGLNATNGIRFSITGIMTETKTDSAVNRNGSFTETQVVSMPIAQGEGVIDLASGDQRQAIVSGAVTASGTARQQLN